MVGIPTRDLHVPVAARIAAQTTTLQVETLPHVALHAAPLREMAAQKTPAAILSESHSLIRGGHHATPHVPLRVTRPQAPIADARIHPNRAGTEVQSEAPTENRASATSSPTK